MEKSTIQYLIISSFLLLFIASCSSLNVVKDYKTVAVEKPTFEVPYFTNSTMDYVYKANITVYGNEISGIFIAKKINETTHRVVLTTEFGNKLLDFEISETDFKINFIVEDLDRKMVINTLETDFRLLLKSQYIIQNQFEDTENKVLLSEENKMNTYLFVNKQDNILNKISYTSKRKEKINLFYTTENNIFAQKIIIQHTNIKLKIELNYLNPQIN